MPDVKKNFWKVHPREIENTRFDPLSGLVTLSAHPPDQTAS